MNAKTLIGIVVVLIPILGTIVLIHQHQSGQLDETAAVDLQSLEERAAHVVEDGVDPSLFPGTPSDLPRLVDLGADNCVPCKLMAPILQELKAEYTEVFITHFIDVWKNPDAGRQFNVRMIPTQIFFDTEGKELFRHEGFMSKQDILIRWRQLGVSVATAG